MFPAPEFTIDYRDIDGQKQLLREQLDGFGWKTSEILTHLDSTARG